MLEKLYTFNSNFDIFILVIGGLSIFLFGLNLTKENLRNLANKKLQNILFKCTNTPLKSFIVGIIATILIQSSSGVTAIVVSFIAAGYLTFSQGLGIMIGANIGTCTTVFLIGFDIQDNALLIISLASLFIFITKNKQKQMYFQALLGVGIIFLGLQFMEIGFIAIAESKEFATIIYKYSNNSVVSFLVGIILTFLIQSSSAIIGILEQLYAAHIMTLMPAITMMLGSNIGTTLTGFYATIRTNTEAKKAVLANVLFNVLGAILFLILLYPFTFILLKIESWDLYKQKELTIANAHLIFNILTVVIAYFFFGYLVKLTEQIFFSKRNKKAIQING